MQRLVALSVLTWLSVAPATGLVAFAAKSPIAHRAVSPSIVITSPRPGAVIHGSTLTVSVAVHNFRLVAPQLKNPPVLKGNAGHLHYVLDSLANFVVTRDATAAVTHTWTHVSPGRHTVTVYLSTAQHATFPGTKPASVTVTLAAVAPSTPPASHPTGRANTGIHRGPATGGGVGAVALNGTPLNTSLLLAALAALFFGIAMLGRRVVFSPGGNGASANVSRDEVSAFRLTSVANDPPTPQTVADSPPATAVTQENTELSSSSAEGTPSAGAADDIEPPVAADSPAATSVGVERDDVRRQALAMARQWGDLVEGLVAQLDRSEAERTDLHQRITALEETVRTAEATRVRVRQMGAGTLSAEEIEAARYVTDSLLDDPDHIVVLAAVAQHADTLHRMVGQYAELRQVIDNL